MKDRIASSLHYEEAMGGQGVRAQALLPLHHLFVTQGHVTRAEFKAMSGLGDRQATQLISDMLKAGFIKTDSAYGPLSFGIPARALRFYFPALWPEAEQDEAIASSSRRTRA